MSAGGAAEVRAVHRYPVKGLSGEALERANLDIGRGIPHDRRWGITGGKADGCGDSPGREGPGFLTVREHAEFTGISASVSGEGRLRLRLRDGTAVLDEPADDQGLSRKAGAAIGASLGLEGLGLVDHAHDPLWDYPGAFLSLINLATVRELSAKAGADLDVRRFRGNIILECREPWAEIGWVGRDIRVGPGLVLRVVREIPRCKATCIDPDTGRLDVPVPMRLREHYGHKNLGVLAAPITAGALSPGDWVDNESAVWKS